MSRFTRAAVGIGMAGTGVGVIYQSAVPYASLGGTALVIAGLAIATTAAYLKLNVVLCLRPPIEFDQYQDAKYKEGAISVPINHHDSTFNALRKRFVKGEPLHLVPALHNKNQLEAFKNGILQIDFLEHGQKVKAWDGWGTEISDRKFTWKFLEEINQFAVNTNPVQVTYPHIGIFEVRYCIGGSSELKEDGWRSIFIDLYAPSQEAVRVKSDLVWRMKSTRATATSNWPG